MGASTLPFFGYWVFLPVIDVAIRMAVPYLTSESGVVLDILLFII
jgi:hypothetical protein